MKRKYLLPLFLLFQVVLVKLIGCFPAWVEEYYSQGFFQIIARALRSLLGNIPFSVGDLLYAALIIYILFKTWKLRKSWRSQWKDRLLGMASFLAVFYFLFHLLWGLNYYRLPLHQKLGIGKEYSTAQLIAFTERLIAKANSVQVSITQDKNTAVHNLYPDALIFELSQPGYDKLALVHADFRYQVGSRKKSLFGLPLTYMGFGGYLNPFTNEAHINPKLPRYGLPNVVTHEMAHQIGYASESDCNFIGFLACAHNDDLYFQYSAYATALRYCLNNILEKDPAAFEKLKAKIHPGILENYKQSKAFWAQYDTFIDKGFHAFYDQFLKANQQTEGMESYSKFVGLLVNYYRNRAL